MILDTFAHLDKYIALIPELTLVKTWIEAGKNGATPPIEETPIGDSPLDGDKVFLRVSEASGKGESGARVEYHRQYIDVQIPLRGHDRIGYLPIENCSKELEPYKAGPDIGFYADKPETYCDVKEGWFCILFPEDAHAPLAFEGKVKKAIVKIRVRE